MVRKRKSVYHSSLCDTKTRLLTSDSDSKFIFQFKKKENEMNNKKVNEALIDNYGKPYLDIYVPFDKLQTVKVGTSIFVMGVIVGIQSGYITVNKNGDDLLNKNFKLSDLTKKTINVVIWGKRAENFCLELGSIVRLDDVKLSDYGGISLEIKDKTCISDITGQSMSISLMNYWEKINNSK